MPRKETTFDKIPIKGHFYLITVSTLSSFLFVTNYTKITNNKARITSTTDYTNKKIVRKTEYFQNHSYVYLQLNDTA